MSGIEGVGKTRRLLRSLPDALRDEIAVDMRQGGEELLADEKAEAPFKTGAVRNALSMRFLPRSLSLRVGLIGKAINRKLFYARIVHWGRKAKTVRVYRRGRTVAPQGRNARGNPFYLMKVAAMPARKFVIRPRPELWARFNERLKARWSSVLRRASGG